MMDLSQLPPGPPESDLPEDVRTPWGWGAVFGFVLVAVMSLFVVTAVAYFAAVVWFHTRNPVELLVNNAALLSLRQVVWYLLLMLYLFATIRRRGLPFWRTIGWRPLAAARFSGPALYALLILTGMVLAVAVELAALPFHPKTRLPIEALFRDRQSLLWLTGMGVLVAPVVEETIFRSYLYPVLARSLGIRGAVVATGLLFGLLHLAQLWGGWVQVGLIALVGMILTYARARSGSVLASYLLHLGYNTFLFAGFYFSTGGFRHLPPGLVG